MASLNQIATVFAGFKYDKDVGFKNVKGVPCLACVSNLDRDISCKCVWAHETTSCVLCDHFEKTCGSMPPQLLGVAQWYWNFVKDLSARDSKGEHRPLVDTQLTGRQFWRINLALEACGAAWREVEGHFMDPNNSTMILLQDLASTREIMTAFILQSAGANISYDELRDRIVALQPAYTRDDNCIVTLRGALNRLSVAENTVVQSVPEREDDSLPYDFPSELQSDMWNFRKNQTPDLVVVHNGMPNSLDQNRGNFRNLF